MYLCIYIWLYYIYKSFSFSQHDHKQITHNF